MAKQNKNPGKIFLKLLINVFMLTIIHLFRVEKKAKRIYTFIEDRCGFLHVFFIMKKSSI